MRQCCSVLDDMLLLIRRHAGQRNEARNMQGWHYEKWCEKRREKWREQRREKRVKKNTDA